MEKWQYIKEDKQYSIYLWILNIPNINILKMLYGFAVPIKGSLPNNRWFSAKIEEHKEIEATIIRLSCYIKGKELKSFADMLLMGDSLRNISLGLGINNTPENYSKLALIKEHYRQRPPVFLETSYSASYYRQTLEPIASFADNPMICESLYNIDKIGLFQVNGLTEPLELMVTIKNVLTKELSLRIPGPDSERLGNFEIFSFPFEENDDFSPIKIETIKEGTEHLTIRTVKVSIKPDKFKGNIYLRCRLRNGNVIVGDHLTLIHNADDAQDILFHSQENCSDIETTVWDADPDPQKPITLLYEHRVPLMRTMHLTMEMKGLQGKLETQWLKKLSRKSGGKSIHNHFERISRSFSEAGGHEDDPWVPAARTNTTLFNENFPDKSDAQFFSKGWQDEDRFVKWLQGIVGKNSTYKVVLIDPYFDDEAVTKFIAMANYNDVAYEVITDVGFRDGASEQIIGTCKECKLIIPHDVRIYGLRRSGSGTVQIFHDRFLILFGESQLPMVYMISNSISGVSKKFPSVVVPVPPDVAIEIEEYYRKLVHGGTEDEMPEVVVEPLWPLEADEMDCACKKEFKDRVKDFPGFEDLMEEGAPQISQDEDERNRQFDSIGARLSHLLSKDEDEALKLWTGIANWSVRIPDSDRVELFQWFEGSLYKKTLIDVAGLCIKGAVNKPYPVGVLDMEYRTESISVAANSLAPFSDLRRLSDSLIEFHFDSDYPSVYSLSIAFEFLLMNDPNDAFETLNYVVKKMKDINGLQPTKIILPYYKAISTCLRVLALELVRRPENDAIALIKVGFGCNVTIVRAMCASAISYYLVKRDFFGEKRIAYNTIIDLVNYIKSSVERTYALSWIAYDCQVLRNQKKDNSLVVNIMEYIKKKVVEDWEALEEGSDQHLHPILKNFSGPLEGGHSDDICDILRKLVEKSIIQNQIAAEYLKNFLYKKINNHFEGGKGYYQDVDYKFTLNMILFLTSVAPESCSSLIGEIEKIVNKAKRQIIKPFARSLFYTEWTNSIETLCWCGIIIANCYTRMENDQQKMETIFNDIFLLILPYKDDFSDNMGFLHNFLKESTAAKMLKESGQSKLV